MHTSLHLSAFIVASDLSRATPLRYGMAYVAGTMRPKGRQSGAGGQTQISPGGTGVVWQEPSITLQDSETTNTPTRVRQFLKKGVVKFQEVSYPPCMSVCSHNSQWHHSPS